MQIGLMQPNVMSHDSHYVSHPAINLLLACNHLHQAGTVELLHFCLHGYYIRRESIYYIYYTCFVCTEGWKYPKINLNLTKHFSSE